MIYVVEENQTQVPDPIIKLEIGRKHWFLHRFIPTQYFNSFVKSKIYFRGTLEVGEFTKPFFFHVKNCYSRIPRELKIPIEEEVSFTLKKGKRECISKKPIKCRFPIPDIYYFSTIYTMSQNYPKGTILPTFYCSSDENIISNKDELIMERRPLVIVQDYFSYKVTQLTIWLTVLTGVLIIQSLFPRFIPGIISLIKSIF